MNEVFEPNPRWPGAPRICVEANLPAFDTPADAAAYRKQHCPSSHVLVEWQCRVCRCWHFWAAEPGNTNGEHRAGAHDLPRQIRELIERTRVT